MTEIHINNLNQKPTHFKSNIRSTKDEAMSEKYYTKTDDSIDVNKYGSMLLRKAKGLPSGIDGVFFATAKYLDGTIELDRYMNLIMDRAIPVFQKIQFSKGSEEFVNSYNPEITLIRKMVPACAAYGNKEINDEEFNGILEESICEYEKSQNLD